MHLDLIRWFRSTHDQGGAVSLELGSEELGSDRMKAEPVAGYIRVENATGWFAERWIEQGEKEKALYNQGDEVCGRAEGL